MRWATRTFVILLLLPAAAFASAASLSSSSDSPCPDFAERPGLGPSCPVEGGFDVLLAGGERVFTHGVDPVLGHLWGLGEVAPPMPPACVQDTESEFHGQVIYARPSNVPERTGMTHELREMVALANGLLRLEAAELGAVRDYRFACTPDGEVDVDVVLLPLPEGSVTFANLQNALTSLGYDNPRAKYWVWLDEPESSCGCSGIASLPRGFYHAPQEPANSGPTFAATYRQFGPTGAYVMMHENGHNLGAVANTAPDSSGGGHCNDGRDIMCYADGGSKSAYDHWVCADRPHYDCGHDTYFHPDPAGGYLANRWNVGSPLNRFLEGCSYQRLDLLPGLETMVEVPSACVGRLYDAYADPLPTPQAAGFSLAWPDSLQAPDVDTCWYADGARLRCDARFVYSEGRVPAGATHAGITLAAGIPTKGVLSIG